MAFKLSSVCLLAAALLGNLSSAQYFKIVPTQEPQSPQLPQNLVPPVYSRPATPGFFSQAQSPPVFSVPREPQKPNIPQLPREPQRPNIPQLPREPQKPNIPQLPREPQKPSIPQLPREPQKPSIPQLPREPQKPSIPQLPREPQKPSIPQLPREPQKPSIPVPQYPQKPKDPYPQYTKNPSQEFQSCEVEAQYKIQCGLPGISASQCQAISCCFDGQMCYYGKSVTLQCTKDAQFIVVVARDATLPSIDLESIHFMGEDQNCRAVGTTSAFAIYQFPVTSCGTTVMEDENGLLIYENRMSSSYEVAVGPYGAITRDTQFDLMIQCRYVGTSVEALVVEVGLLPAPLPVAAPGPLRVELRLGNGQCTMKGCVEEDVAYGSYYLETDYPVTKVLRDPVYVEVRMLERTDPNLVLTLGRCWATSSPYPQSLPQWDLLVDGCPYRDDRYQTTLVNIGASSGLMYPTHYRRFIFKMFTFVASGPADPTKKLQGDGILMPIKEKVYIHCNTAVCQPTLQNNCQPRCFRKKRDIMAAVKSDSRPETTTVTSQGIIIVDQTRD